MPHSPDDAENQTGPEGGEAALQERQGQPAPAELLDRTEDQGQRQRRQRRSPGENGNGSPKVPLIAAPL